MVKKKGDTKKSKKKQSKVGLANSIAAENLPDTLFRQRLVEEVSNGDLDAQQIIHLTDLIDAALYLESQADIENVALYLSGRVSQLRKSIKKDFEFSLKPLFESIGEIDNWGAWDIRMVHLIAHPKWWATANWKLLKKVAEQIRQSPGKDYFNTVYEILLASGLDETEIKRHCLREFSRSYFSDDGVVTSAGRWLLQQLNQDYQQIMALADLDWVPIGIAGLLMKIDAARFESCFDDFQFEEFENKLRYCEMLLQHNKEKYKSYVFEVFARATKTKFHFSIAKLLLIYFGNECKQQAFDESLKALDILRSDDFYYDEKLEYIRWLLENFNADGLRLVEANYDEENNLARIDYYGLLSEVLGNAALPILVHGFAKFNKSAKRGNVDQTKYVADLFDILAKYDLVPYESIVWNSVGDIDNARIRDRLARVWLAQAIDPISVAKSYLSNKKSSIRCAAVSLLFFSQKVEAETLIKQATEAEKSTTAKRVMQYYLDQVEPDSTDIGEGYNFDLYTRSLAQQSLLAIKKHLEKIQTPINYIKFYHDDLSFEIERILIGREHRYLEVELPQIRSDLPSGVDYMWHPGLTIEQVQQERGNVVFAEFLRRHAINLEDESLPSWPDGLYKLEILLVGEAIKTALIQEGVEFDSDFYICIGDHDSERDNPQFYHDYVKREIAGIISNAKMLKDYAAICYHSEEKRLWLAGLYE